VSLQATCVNDAGIVFWDVVSDCQPENQVNCEGLPQPNPYNDLVNAWPEGDPVCNLGAAGDVCMADCVAGKTGGGALAICNGETGVWEVDPQVDCA
jgi:hypothetical protein